MSAQIVQAACSYCGGSGRAETLMERSESGKWLPNVLLDHHLADAWIAADPNAPIRWEPCDCPICYGAGTYELEAVACRVF